MAAVTDQGGKSSLIEANINGPAIRFSNFALIEGSQTILSEVSTTFEAGLWHGIMGPNGGGKSSLLKSLLGLNNHKGQISLNWPTSDGKTEKRFGYVPQISNIDGTLPVTVHDFLIISGFRQSIWRRRTLPEALLQALAKVNLDTKLARRIGDLSGGEKQRLLLVMALFYQPNVLILDEPSTGLDKTGLKLSLELVSEFQHAGGTVLMVEHNWELLKRHCHRLYWVDKTITRSGAEKDFESAFELSGALS